MNTYSFTNLTDIDINNKNKETYSNIFDKWINIVDKTGNKGLHEKCYELFIKNLKGNCVLDVGCGPGLDSTKFYEDGYDVYSADIQFGFVKSLKTKINPLNGLVMDMRYPAFKPASFDGIFGIASFLHIPHTYSLDILRKFHSLLKKDAVLFLHHVCSETDEDGYIVENVLDSGGNLYCFCLSECEIKDMLKICGYSEIIFYYLINDSQRTKIMIEKGLRTYQVIAKK